MSIRRRPFNENDSQVATKPIGGQVLSGKASPPGSLVPIGVDRAALKPLAKGRELDHDASTVSAHPEAGMPEAGSCYARHES